MMRWKKRHVKRFNKIVKTYYNSNDSFASMLYESITPRRYPQCYINVRSKSKNRYTVDVYEESTTFLGTRISVPSYMYSRVKRSRVQGVLTGYLMLSIDEVKDKLTRNFSYTDFEIHDIILGILSDLENGP